MAVSTNNVNQSVMDLYGAMTDGSARLVNPVAAPARALSAQTQTMNDQVRLQLNTMDPSNPNFPTLRGLQTTLADAGSQIGQLTDHTNAMIFGDGNGSVISGGLTSNLGQVMSALNLNNQMVAAGQTPLGTHSDGDPCAIFGDFFGSLLGQGRELLNQIGAALNQLLQPITQLINQINTAISAGMAALRQAINTAVGAIRDAINSIANMIRDELDAFAKWLGAAINLNLSSFLSNVFNNSCAKLLISAIANPVTLQILSLNTAGTLASKRPGLGSVF